MSSDRAETAIIALVVAASASVLAAPVAGRAGASGLAQVLALGAAACGLAAFATAGVTTLRAARRNRSPEDDR